MYPLPKLSIEEILFYLRKSRADDPSLTVEEVLAKHEQMLNEWVERNMPDQGPVPEENRLREVVSGETIDSRPRMVELLKRIESPKIKAIVVVEPQRLSRGDLEDIGRLVKLLRYSNTIVITLTYTYDLRDAHDRDSFERELKRGNEYLEYQKRIMGNGRVLAVENGYFVGNRPPYGYEIVQVKEDKKRCFVLSVIPEQAEVVKMIFDLYLNGNGMGRISDHLLSLGIKPPTGGKKWSHNTMMQMLQNEHYLGKVRWFHRKTVKTVEDGEVVAHRPKAEKYLVYPGKHPAIIDQETFDAVQKKIGLIPKTGKKLELKNPLAGIFRCSCGEAMVRKQFVIRGVERAAPRYECRNQRHCGNASCTAAELMDEVRKQFQAELTDLEARMEAGTDNSYDIHLQAIERLEKRLADLELLEISQWEKYTMEAMPRHIFDQLNKKVLAEKAEVQQSLCIAKDSIPEPVRLEDKVNSLHLILDRLSDPEAPVEELNAIIKEFVSQVTYSRPKTACAHGRWNTGSDVQVHIDYRV